MRRTRNNARNFGSDITNFQALHPRPILSENHLASINLSLFSKEKTLEQKQQWRTQKENKKKEKELHSKCFVEECLSEIMSFTSNYQTGNLNDHCIPMNRQCLKEQEKFLFQSCPELTVSMRNILVEWLIQVHSKMCLRYETLYLTIFLVDKYCSLREVPKTRYQLLAITCLFIAGKYQEIATPKMKKFVTLCDMLYGVEDILQMESQILLLLNFKISEPSINWFLGAHLFAICPPSSRSFSKTFYQKFERSCYYMLQLVLFEIGLLKKHHPQIISCSILYYICMQEQFVSINPKKSTSYLNAVELKQTRECSVELRKMYKNRLESKYESVNNKYPDLAIPDSEL